MVDSLAPIPLEVDPGARWIYGISTDLVGYLCEVLSGLRFDQYLQQRILGPLGMPDTGFSVPPAEVARFAANYAPKDGTFTLIDDPLTSAYTRPRTYFSGSGGLVSTMADYLRFCRMLGNGGELDGVRIIGPRTLSLMTTNHLPGGKDLASMAQNAAETQREGQGFGLGFAMLLDPAVAQVIGTPGEYYWGGAASTAFFVNPAEDLIMIFLTAASPIVDVSDSSRAARHHLLGYHQLTLIAIDEQGRGTHRPGRIRRFGRSSRRPGRTLRGHRRPTTCTRCCAPSSSSSWLAARRRRFMAASSPCTTATRPPRPCSGRPRSSFAVLD